MISVFEVVVDPDLIAPQPFTVLRSTGQYVLGGFASTTTSISLFGPDQQASDKEVQMLPEADRISAVRSFWSTQPIYETRGYAPVPSTHGETPTGSGTAYTLSSDPPLPAEALCVYADGRLLPPSAYTVSGTTLTFQTAPAAPLYVTWPITATVQAAASDLIEYGSEQYRVLRVYFDPGGGYYKAYGTRMAAA